MRSFLFQAIVSLVAAALARAAIAFLQSGKPVFSAGDPLFLWLAAVFLLTIGVFQLVASRLFRCTVCGKFSQDIMVFDGKRTARFCREHLVARFRQEFAACDQKMVVVYPALEMKKGPYTYEYRPVDSIPERFLPTPFGRIMTRALASIGGRCGKCGRNATLAYFGPGNTPWTTISSIHETDTGEISATFLVACPNCIVDELCFSLNRFESPFSEGIILPHGGTGVLMSRLA